MKYVYLIFGFIAGTMSEKAESLYPHSPEHEAEYIAIIFFICGIIVALFESRKDSKP